MKKCIYTCITGNYDSVNEIKNKEPDFDYYLFTNNKKIVSKTWNVIYIEDKKLNNTKLARKIKILGHDIIKNNYDISIWIDGNFSIEKSLNDFLKKYLKDDDKMVCYRHTSRKSIAEEMDACIEHQKESIHNIDRLKKYYNKEGFKDNNGLIESSILVRKHNDPQVEDAMKLWFYMIENYSERDQLSFNYVIDKKNFKVHWINESVWNIPWFKSRIHKKAKQKEEYKVYISKDKEYKENNCIKEKYNVKNGVYTAKIKNPIASNEIRFDPTEIYNMKAIDLKTNLSSKYKIELVDCLKIDNTIYFINDDPKLIISGPLKKDQVIEISMKLKKSTKKDSESIKREVCRQQELIKNYEDGEERLLTRLKEIETSKSWMLLEKIRMIIRRPGK